MDKLNLPGFSPKLEKRGNDTLIFDAIRKKYLILTPEEWVRQHFLNFLIAHRGYPAGLIKVEQQVMVSGMPQRADIVVHDRNGLPLMVIECKAPGIELSNAVFAQAARYNLTLGAKYLTITNGMAHYCCLIDLLSRDISYLEGIPTYSELLA